MATQKNFRVSDSTADLFKSLFSESGEVNESSFFEKLVIAYANPSNQSDIAEKLQGKDIAITELANQNNELATKNKLASEDIEKYIKKIDHLKQLLTETNENGQIATRLQIDIDNLQSRLQKAIELPVKTMNVVNYYSRELQNRKGISMTPAEMMNDLFIKYVKIQPSQFSFPFVTLTTFKQ